MPIRNRPTDACPGVLAVHHAADGGVARVRVPGGQLSAAAFRTIATAAAELGDGTIELTSRANLQVRGLADGAEAELAERLASAGLLPSATHEKVRNIMASPLTGLDGGGFADVRPLVSGVDRALCARPPLAELSGRFLFAVDDGRGDVAGLGADVTALVVARDAAAVLLGGTDHGLRAELADVIDVMLACAEAFLAERDEEWRLAELGADALRRVAERAGAADPAGGGVLETARPRAVGPLGPVGACLVAGAPLGWLGPGQAAALAATGADLVVTPWRSVVVADLDDPAPVARALAAEGLLLDPGTPRVTACTGRPGCAKALADVRADARPVSGVDIPVHWSGCARRCGRPRGEVLDVVATGDGYTTMRGDR